MDYELALALKKAGFPGSEYWNHIGPPRRAILNICI